MDGSAFAIVGVIWLLCAFLGAAIGSPKGLGGIGFVLGLFLGLIGLVIVAVMPPAQENRVATHRQPAQEGKWWPDPYGTHQYRYYNGHTWTAQVSDQGRTGIDPRPGLGR